MKKQSKNRNQFVFIDLHCHSDASDGYYSPALTADFLSREGVSFAALTDHNSIDGIVPFHKAAAGSFTDIVGVEISVDFEGNEYHVLAYGFDPKAEGIQDLLRETPSFSHAASVIHQAEGIVFLAHPLQPGLDQSDLETRLEAMVQAGLDGIEAFYKPYPEEVQQELAALADQLGILTCGGSDYHGQNQGESPMPGVIMPADRWKQFTNALGDHGRNGLARHTQEKEHKLHNPNVEINWQWLFLQIILPSLLVIGIFIFLIFGMLIPTMEQRLLERRREMTSELTNSAWSILADYEREVQEENMNLEQAQQNAIERIRRLRYGPEEKDYFWITDMYPRMIMHPYRTDLEGADLTDFTDIEGNRPFIEFVSAVRRHSSGYVRYFWQWQDDPDRMEAKESYVRKFAPWGWIIGTGLYVDDVEREIQLITGRMIDISFIVIILSSGLLATVTYQSLKVEKKRGRAEQELSASHERYRTLVESSTSGTMLLADGKCIYANRTLLDMLGYTSAELAFLDIHEIIICEETGVAPETMERIVHGEEADEPIETRVRRKNGRTLPVLLSATPVFFADRSGMLINLQDITKHRAKQSEAERDRLIAQLQSSQLFLTEPIRDSMDIPVTCSLDSTIAHAVRLMTKSDVDAITVLGNHEELVGIITDHDIRKRVAARDLDTRLPVSRIMSAPVQTINEYAPVFEAFMVERERSISHLAVIDDAGNLTGIVRGNRLLQPERYSLLVLIQQIKKARNLDELGSNLTGIPVLVGSMVESGSLPRNITHVTTAASDAAAQRIISLALEELGPAPVPFAFIALGSEARKEQTLATDQDNALIYDGEDSLCGEYFLNLGKWVCDGLDQVGYRHCRGETMAKNPRWNQSLENWRKDFSNWVIEPDGEALSRCKVFFDLRCIYGEDSLVQDLQRHIDGEIKQHPAFLSHMALNTLNYKPPLGFFGQIVADSTDEGKNTVNLKEAMLPMVNFARLYALKHQVEQTNTFDRLSRLRKLDVLKEKTWRTVTQAYGYLLQLRFQHQTEMISSSEIPDNSIDPDTLTQMELGMVKHSFSQISLIQKKASYDFQVTE